MARRALVVVGFLGLWFGAVTCTFPDVTFEPESSGATESGATGGEAGRGGGGVGGAGTSGAGGAAGGGAAGAAGAAGGATTTSTETLPDPCPYDNDGDGAVSWQCPEGTDCSDDDPSTHPGITEFSGVPVMNAGGSGVLPYDKNCDGVEEAETPTLACNFGNCPQDKLGFQQDVPCGMSGALGHCKSVLFVDCTWEAENPPKTAKQQCK